MALTAGAGSQLAPALRLRIAPILGIAITTVPTLLLSRLGLPVGQFALPLVLVTAIAATVTLVRNRPAIPRADAIGIIAPLVPVIAILAFPLFRFGFDWVSFSNDDMTNYALSANRFVEQSYFATPSIPEVEAGRHLEELMWGLYYGNGERAGSEITLAVLSALLHTNAMFLFMSFITAGYLAMITAAGALVDLNGNRRTASLATFLAGVAPLSLFGMYYQLLGQIFGLGVLIASAAVWFRDFEPITRAQRIALGGVRALLAAAVIAIYPELSPMLIIGFIAFATARLIRKKRLHFPVDLAISALSAVAVLGTYSVVMFHLVQSRLTSVSNVTNDVNNLLFPYYLLPSGIATLWGFETIGNWYLDPLQSIVILAGLILCVLAAIGCAYGLVKTTAPAAYVLLPLMIVTVSSTVHQSGFALYKLAMYVQPFMLAVLLQAVVWLTTSKPRLQAGLAFGLSLAFAATWAPATFFYTDASMDGTFGTSSGFAEIRRASSTHLLSQLHDLASAGADRQITSDTSNVSLGKIEAGFFPEDRLSFRSRYFIAFALFGEKFVRTDAASNAFEAQYYNDFIKIRRKIQFPHCRPAVPTCVADFYEDQRSLSDDPANVVLGSSAFLSVLNRDKTRAINGDVYITPYQQLDDHLVLMNTTIGGAPGATFRDKVSLFQLEADPFYANSTFAALGRYLTFSVEKPRKSVRMILDLTETLQNDGQNTIPNAVVAGTYAAGFSPLGRGSARLLSAPITPATYGDMSVVGLDMGSPGIFFPDKKTGLMELFGRDIRRDSRRVSGFARDISLVDADSQPEGPASVSKFPDDLQNPELFYSGVYEDGYSSEASRFTLRSTGTGHLHLRGLIPAIGDPLFRTHVSIAVDGRVATADDFGVGNFDLVVPGIYPPATYNIEIHFDRPQRIPYPDSRIIGCKIDSVGFEQ